MSFLDVLDSLGGGQDSQASRQPEPQAPAIRPSYIQSNLTKSSPNSATHPLLPTSMSSSEARKKRSAEDAFSESSRSSAPQAQAVPQVGSQEKGRKQASNDGIKFSNSPKSQTQDRAGTTSTTRQIASSGPPKGSFAALMAEAKTRQEQNTRSEVGQIKHQATIRERISAAQKRKRQEAETPQKTKLGKSKTQQGGKINKKDSNESAVDNKGRNMSLNKREESTYTGTAKPATKLAIAQTAPPYKGTAGLASKYRASTLSATAKHKGLGKAHTKPTPRKRYDEYLGTDEEDNDDQEGYDYDNDTDMDCGSDVRRKGRDDNYASDVSSDMEADAFDLEEEESQALRHAKADDAKELALESKLKRQKEERRRKLQTLASKRQR